MRARWRWRARREKVRSLLGLRRVKMTSKLKRKLVTLTSALRPNQTEGEDQSSLRTQKAPKDCQWA